ncbi:hypothetical protein SAMN05421813_101235 [Daejeonella rubra]|uniref:Uncharacterized protein n=1 Tax=Daejeonella rubra TaxID=990371 RepID=A0A1G9M589_9SPHI|nr:hypothetical protein [Daejeonella rubra]SDL69376.1 hypothetical protein SAMN05421813_101235 [Daejeonella rubra]
MKKNIIALITGMLSLISLSGNAQVSVNFNIGSQPLWGPTGYDQAEYYYLPDIETYYYVPKRQFIYMENGIWLHRSALPGRYARYDLNRGYKVVMNSPRPYNSYKSHKVKYAKYKSYSGRQPIIRYSKDQKYSQSKGNYSNSHSNGGQKGNNGNGNSGKGNNGKGKH